MKKLKILYEDKDFIVIDKPSGLLTISTDNEKEKTLFHQVYTFLKQKHKKNKVFIVHRLDKDTSGIVLFSKNERVKNILQKNWNELMIHRKYIAIVEGNVEKKNDTIKSWLKENKNLISYSTNQSKDSKLAVTKYKKVTSNKSFSLLEIEILTGRKNQIRVHMSEMHHPIIGDKKYGSLKNPIHRLGLHATYLEFRHPITNQVIKIESKVPKEFLEMFKGKGELK